MVNGTANPDASAAPAHAHRVRPSLVRFGQILCLGLLALTGLACSEKRVQRTPVLTMDNQQFGFSKASVGEQPSRTITLTNEGNYPLSLKGIRLVEPGDRGVLSLHIVDAAGARHSDPPKLIEIAPGGQERVYLTVIYTPTDSSPLPPGARVQFESNDPDQLSVELPILIGQAQAELLINPATVHFDERVIIGHSASRTLRLQNIGHADLVIDELRIDGAATEVKLKIEAPEQPLPSEGAPIVLAPFEHLAVEVRYTPHTLMRLENTQVVIVSNDVQARERTVPIVGNTGASCINIQPDPIDFGAAVLLGDLDEETPNRRAITIESCGVVPLEVKEIRFEGPAFGFTQPPEAEEANGSLFTLPGRREGDTFGPHRVLEVGFWPTAEQGYGGRMLVYTNVSSLPVIVELFGRGVRNACPIPEVRTNHYDVAPLEIIVLDGSPSIDPEGRVVRWEWSIVSRPDGSTSEIVESFTDPQRPADGGEPDDPTTPEARFFVDLAGTYEIELRVYDELGQASCDPLSAARVTVEAVPDRDLHVQLVWHTPADPDETDSFGTDLDLHLRHANGHDAWGNAANGWDCFYSNKTPDWGVQGDPNDDPSLDIDDTNGAGPENINLSQPEEGGRYSIGAVYFRSESTFGLENMDPRTAHLSLATVRIYARGELLFELIDREMTRTDQLWHVADLEWCGDDLRCPMVTPVDRLYQFEEWYRP